MARWPLGVLIGIFAALLAIVATTPPRPAPVDAPATSFSATRAMTDIRAAAPAPRSTPTRWPHARR